MKGALVIGAGPAGLMAAEEIARAGHPVVVAEAMPTPARKFLMAGKSGLNLTRDEPAEAFARNMTLGTGGRLPPDPRGYFGQTETGFGPAEVMDWARGLGIALFTGSTGRVFPVGMKASPLLRAWLARLAGMGVDLRSRWRWQGFEGDGLVFDTPSGRQVLHPDASVLALGGASWPRLGSDAAWVPWLAEKGVAVAPFRPANMGLRVDWSPAMTRHFGQPVKGVAIHAGGQLSRGEWVISRHGIEGGGIYAVAAAIRDGAEAVLDLAPDLDAEALAVRFAKPRGKLSIGNWLRRVLGDPVRAALLLEWGRPLPADPRGWALRAKALPLRHQGPAGLDRAISSAGGIRLDGLTAGLELRTLPGIFAAGEMLDWEAPTGGYLLTHSLGSGRWAGRAVADYLRESARR
ncbi:BaiN/RdsA family NAD(P)/FAD-dependent oxidoreductase [Paracoccus xiamenensis]|uniref:NAD(P)/FAD-dependent oxidoreductase n=1 Tax=Paracoccus xiamenensis TaxID=2714901 RepID=UPI00140B008F|nr:TIGR03862 family flavoprotein [Paracoccus xiamenensis]NHF74356.1 TIGR03862 family flavoprotein [Paracoccus xiamenensis]